MKLCRGRYDIKANHSKNTLTRELGMALIPALNAEADRSL